MALSTSSHSHQSLSHISHGCRVLVPATNIGVEPLGHIRFIAAIALEDLRVELALAITWHLQVFDPTRGGDQIAAVGAIAIAFAPRTALTPAHSDEGFQLLTHDSFQDDANTGSGQFAQMLLELLLIRQHWGCLFLALRLPGEVCYPSSYDDQA